MATLTCGFIGLGLIGGSIAKAIRLRLPDARLIAYDINSAFLELAKQEQVLDHRIALELKTVQHIGQHGTGHD